MVKVQAAPPVGCAEHPHRESADHCDECRRGFCGECLVRGRPQLLCHRCWGTAPQREALAARRRHPLYRRLDALRAHRASVVAGGVIAAVLTLLAASGAAQVLSPAYRTHIGEAVAATRRGVPAGAPAEPRPAGAPGATLARVPTLIQAPCCGQGATAEQIPGTNGGALVDGIAGPLAPVWQSPAGFTTADLRLRVQDTSPTARVLFAHSTAAPPETWAKDVEVWISLHPDGADPIRLGQWTLGQATGAQEFPCPPTRVASVRLRVVSNYGSSEYASLAEFALLPPPLGG